MGTVYREGFILSRWVGWVHIYLKKSLIIAQKLIFFYTIPNSMKLKPFPLKLYLKKLATGGFFAIGLCMNIFVWLWLWLHIPRGVEDLFLHYNILFGVDLIGPAWHVYLVPLSGLIILLVNVIVGWFCYKKEPFAAYVLNFIACFMHIFLVIEAFLLVLLNV